MRNVITIQKEFNAPLSDVFNLLSKHAAYNTAFAPLQVVRVKDSADPERPDGVGSVRRMGFGVIKPLKEEITHLEENKRIEYKLIDNHSSETPFRSNRVLRNYSLYYFGYVSYRINRKSSCCK